MSRRPDAVQQWAPPPLDDCDEQRVPVALDDDHQISMRRVHWNGQLVAYAIVWSRCIAGRWVEMVCIDTMHHGCVHRHDGDHGATPYKEIRPIRGQEDVQESFKDAYDEVYNAYLSAIGAEPLR